MAVHRLFNETRRSALIQYAFDAERICKWVCEKSGGNYTHLCTAIGIEIDGVLQAAVMYESYTGGNICMVWRVDNPKALTRKFYWMAFDYPFNQLGCFRVSGIVRDDNHKAIKVDEKLGFKREHTLKKFNKDGSDAYIYVMFKEQCKYLEWNK